MLFLPGIPFSPRRTERPCREPICLGKATGGCGKLTLFARVHLVFREVFLMIQRSVFIAVCVCLGASVAATAAPGDAFLFQVPGFSSQAARLLGYPYLANPFNPSMD